MEDEGMGWGMLEGRGMGKGMGKGMGNEGCGKGDEDWEGGVWEQGQGLKPR